jgi:osmoprotectant transport system permease protein
MVSVLDWGGFIAANFDRLLLATRQHLSIALTAVVLGTLVAVPLGIYLTRREGLARIVLAVTGIIQTIPSLAFFGLTIPFLGLGVLPATLVLFLYSILPILRNTYTGIKEVDPALIEAGKGMGMDSVELLLMVELPIALPLILAGVRISTMYIVSWTTVAAMIGAGGLGTLVLGGIAVYDARLIVLGVVPAATLALLAGRVIIWLEKRLTPRGLLRDGQVA